MKARQRLGIAEQELMEKHDSQGSSTITSDVDVVLDVEKEEAGKHSSHRAVAASEEKQQPCYWSNATQSTDDTVSEGEEW